MLSAVLLVLTVHHFSSFDDYTIYSFGDNSPYLIAAHAIHTWNFDKAPIKQFWGVSYAVALLSFLPGVSPHAVLLLICVTCSLASVLLAYQLWGPWVAGYFAVMNFDWMQRSFLGGAEPLFITLLFASFLCIRKERWVWAATLAALASLVRPLGIFALVAIGLVLLYRRDYRKFLTCTAVGALLGALYLLPFWLYYHDALFQMHRYQKDDWTNAGWAVAWPFQALATSFLHNREPLTNVLLMLVWIGFILAGCVAMSRRSFRAYMSEHRTEFLFAFLYIGFLFTYNSQYARAEFPRFAIPVLPFVLIALEPWLPKSRVVLYALCVVASVLAGCSAVGIHNVWVALH
jgi:hypothetical protein